MKKISAPNRGFTLIELLIVITIIGILAIALIPKLIGAPARARDAQRMTDLNQISKALEFYAQDNGEYPDVASPVCVSTLLLSQYMATIPIDPTGAGLGTTCDGTSAGLGGYLYYELDNTNDGAIDGYLLIADLESTSDIGDTGLYKATYITPASTGVSASESFTTNAAATPTRQCSSTSTCATGIDRIYVLGR